MDLSQSGVSAAAAAAAAAAAQTVQLDNGIFPGNKRAAVDEIAEDLSVTKKKVAIAAPASPAQDLSVAKKKVVIVEAVDKKKDHQEDTHVKVVDIVSINSSSKLEDNDNGVPVKLFDSFEGFEVKQVLSNSADYKRIVIEGKVKGQSAVVILDKKPFSEDSLQELFSKGSQLKHTFQNDIYGSYDCIPSQQASGTP
jgi:hypothetical protein